MLLRDITRIKLYLKVNATQTGNAFLPYVTNATEKFIRPIIGKELLALLDAYDNDTSKEKEADEALDALLPYVERALARFTYYLAAPHMDLNVGETGFTATNTQNMVIASSDRVKRYIDSLEEMAWDDTEALLAFLEENKANYESWTESSAYTLQIRNFINSAEEFTTYVSELEGSRCDFIELRSTMDNVELLTIKPTISNELSVEILSQLKENDVSESNALLLPYLKRAVANLAWAQLDEEIKPENYLSEREKVLLERKKKFETIGTNYLAQVKKLLDANPDNYPLYKASDSYNATKPGFGMLENLPENKVYTFGV